MNNIDFRVVGRVETRDNWTDEWAVVDYLQPLESTWHMAPRVSRAKLAYHFGEILREDADAFATFAQLAATNKFCRITGRYEDTDPPTEDWTTYWVGVIRDDTSLIQSHEEEGVQHFEAFGLESLLQTCYLESAKAFSETDSIIDLDWLPPFNRKAKRTRTVLGNRSEEHDEIPSSSSSPVAESPPVYLFGNATDVSTGYKWTNRQIIDYLLKYHAPEGITWNLSGQADELELIEEVHDFRRSGRSVTLFEALNKLIDNKRGFCWHLDARDADESGTVFIVVKTLVKEDVTFGDKTLHANDALNTFQVPDEFPFSHIVEAMQFRRTTAHAYDRIIVQGQPIRVMGTFKADDQSLERLWTGTQANDYVNANGTADPEEADAYRQQDRLADVYRSFRVPAAWNRQLDDITDEDPDRQFYYAVPIVDDEGGVNFGSVDGAGTLWASQKVFSRDTLLRQGYKYSVNPPEREAGDEVDDEFRPMMVWIRDRNPNSPHGQTGKWLWVDKLSRPTTKENLDDGSLYQSAHVRPLDKHMGFHLDISPNHYYGIDHFPPGGLAVTDVDPEFNYDDLVCTAAFTTDRRQYISVDISDPMPDTPRVLYYTVKGAEYWHCVIGTVIDVDEKGKPVKIHRLNNTLRDDRPLLESYAALLQAWYKETRQALRVVVRRISDEYAELGDLWVEVESAGFEPEPVNTVVTSMHIDWTEKSNSMTIETGYDDLDYVGLFVSEDSTGGDDYESLGSPGGGGSPANDDYPLSQLPLRLATGRPDGRGASGIFALVVDKTTITADEGLDVRGKYTCVEIEVLANGTWQEKIDGRTFVNCYESSTGSNANIQLTRTNIVHLWRVSPIEESSSSLSSSEVESSSSSSSANIDRSLYWFDKALGGILRPARV
jgi:hypothetical protein